VPVATLHEVVSLSMFLTRQGAGAPFGVDAGSGRLARECARTRMKSRGPLPRDEQRAATRAKQCAISAERKRKEARAAREDRRA